MPGRVKVLIVDDHPLFRQGLRQVIEADQRFELVGEAGDGKSALQLILEKKPDIAVLDVNLPGLSGLEVARKLQGKRLPTQIVILTMYKEEETFNRAVDFGVKGFVLKENAVQDNPQQSRRGRCRPTLFKSHHLRLLGSPAWPGGRTCREEARFGRADQSRAAHSEADRGEEDQPGDRDGIIHQPANR